MSDEHRVQFLSRPRVVRRLWWLFAVLLALTVLAQANTESRYLR